MSRTVLSILSFFAALALLAQFPGGEATPEPVQLSITSEKVEEGTFDVTVTATIEEGWAVYSQENYGDMGPWPTSMAIDVKEGIELIGTPSETGSKVIDGHDVVFDMQVKKFKGAASFTQRVKAEGGSAQVTGMFEYMTCNDETCLPPATNYFVIDLANGQHEFGTMPFDPADDRFDSIPERIPTEMKLPNVDLAAPVISSAKGGTTLKQGSSLWTIFFLGFIGGLLALLTPCVFPMIPLTVSYFTKGSQSGQGTRNAITYGGFILLIYLIFSIPFHLLGSVDPEIFNEISTNPWLNIFFFVIFIVFAISFFGYFEITLPASWVNSMDEKASKAGGMIGIFFMALTLALVSFSCTGPILGSLLAGALTAEGGAWQLTMGMGGFGLALALPFALFALFPKWLNSLPRSGSWLNTVKVTLGFIELALAIKFLSNADLVMNWGIMPRELFIGLWVVIGLGLTLYLFGAIRFPHDSPKARPSPIRLGTGVMAGAFVLYLIPGLTNGDWRNLKLLSGFPPPLFYSYYEQESECPLDLDCAHDIEEGLVIAKREKKPIMLDFTGWACVNCRKMEENVWPEPKVFDLLSKEYVLVSLYVDDKRELPKDEQFIYRTANGSQKPIVSVGNKWATFQAENFVNASQPLYVLLSPDGKLLTDPVGYTPDADEYKEFLERGLEAMKVLKKEERAVVAR